MDQLTDLTTLATVVGATAFTPLVVQLAKLFTPSSWGERRYKQLSAVVGIGTLVGATVLTGPADVGVIVLAAVNGIIAGVAASSLYDGVHRLGVRTGIIDTD